VDIIRKLKPRVYKRYLFFIAAFVWTFAGGMLLFKGISLFDNIKDFFWLKMSISITGGLLFYFLMFLKISGKHTKRILNLKEEYPWMFSFFGIKSYILMAIMITSGILLRKSGLVSQEHLSLFYILMGIPLLLSSIRFYYYGFFYYKIINKSQ